MRFKHILSFLIIAALAGVGSCKKFVEVDPPTYELSGTTVFSNSSEATAVLTGIYTSMVQSQQVFTNGVNGISFSAGLSADELKNFSSTITFIEFYQNQLSAQSGSSNPIWQNLYQIIYKVNAALEGVSASTTISDSAKSELIGEAKFVRAFLFFYAVNLYGDVPLTTTTDYSVNNTIQRSSVSIVYSQIVQDLLDAEGLLGNNFIDQTGAETTERVRPNRGAVQALLARVYLYMGQWSNAESLTDSLIGNTTNYSLDYDLNDVFLKNSTEAIWQLQPVSQGFNTYDGYYFILTGAPNSTRPVAISANLLEAFEPGDMRYTNWVDSVISGGKVFYYPFKYKVGKQNQPVSEYLMVFRLAEQYLIRAEARAQQGNIGDATADLNVIRNRAGLPNTTANDQPSLISAILHERQVELFTEWGHRWLDLKRTNNINSVMSLVTPEKGGTWNPDWALYPIPQSERLLNSNLSQNPGYN